jgi:hypothetical protein
MGDRSADQGSAQSDTGDPRVSIVIRSEENGSFHNDLFVDVAGTTRRCSTYYAHLPHLRRGRLDARSHRFQLPIGRDTLEAPYALQFHPSDLALFVDAEVRERVEG